MEDERFERSDLQIPGPPPPPLSPLLADIRGPMVQPVDFYGPLVIMSSSDGELIWATARTPLCPISEANEQVLEVAGQANGEKGHPSAPPGRAYASLSSDCGADRRSYRCGRVSRWVSPAG